MEGVDFSLSRKGSLHYIGHTNSLSKDSTAKLDPCVATPLLQRSYEGDSNPMTLKLKTKGFINQGLVRP